MTQVITGNATFDGSRFTLRGSTGVVLISVDAISGRLGSQNPSLQSAADQGPIPQGVYYIDISAIRLRGEVNSEIWGSADAWGGARTSNFVPDVATNTFGRTAFTLHGGTSPGSIGCIDTLDQDVAVIQAMRSIPGGGVIRLEVDYSNYQQSNVDSFLLNWGQNHARFFHADVLVSTLNGGVKCISSVYEGVDVLAFGDRSAAGTLHPARVTRILHGVTSEWIVLDDGTRVTPGHQYLRPDGGFMAISDILALDDMVVDAAGSPKRVTGTLLRATDAGSDAMSTPE